MSSRGQVIRLLGILLLILLLGAIIMILMMMFLLIHRMSLLIINCKAKYYQQTETRWLLDFWAPISSKAKTFYKDIAKACNHLCPEVGLYMACKK
uniref:Uncharacterized protein n=1 Tax=Romanomermis culicivorax TaxID=13658 RepID=A0A915LBY7_ROMCU